MSKTTAITIYENILFSNLRCIKIRKTKVDLMVAIIRAIATVKVPIDICVTATDVSVKQTNPNNT